MKIKPLVIPAFFLWFPTTAFSATNLIDSQYGAGAGSFELPGHSDPEYITLPGGSVVIMGWTVGGASIDWVKTSIWYAAQGNYSIDMNGTAPVLGGPPEVGSLSTAITTTAGSTYRVTFNISGYNSYGNTTNPKQMSVSAGLVLQTFSLTSTYNSATLPLALSWETRTFDFIAQPGSTSIINFQSLMTDNTSGMLLDNVRVEFVSGAVPEPSPRLSASVCSRSRPAGAGVDTTGDEMILEPIATVRSCFGGKFAVPRQPGLCPSAWGRLVFHPDYRSPDAIRGIEGFSHLWLIFGFHETAEQGWKPTVRPPRLGGNQRVGVFATRSTFRPNGLGLSLVRLEGVDLTCADPPVLLLGGLDLIDGTPVYDVKPYLPYAEAVPGATQGFAGDEIPRLTVEVEPAASEDFGRLPERARRVLNEVLSLDARPATQTLEPDRVFGALLCGCNVRFTVCDGVCRICGIEPAQGSGLNA